MTPTQVRVRETPMQSPAKPRISVFRWLRNDGPMTAAFLVPLLVVFGVFAWWPIARSVVISIQRTNLAQPAQWVGLANFERVLNDPLLWTAVGNTVWFVVLALVIGFPVPLFLAIFIGELRRARVLYSILAYLPVIIPPVVAILLWRFFYNPGADGLFNTIAGWVGLGPFPWLQNAGSAMPSIVLQVTWANFGTATIIYLAALASVRTELYEAAEVDGASIWRRVWHITLPQLRGIILIMLLLQVIGTFQLFTEPFLMTGGGPENSTVTILLLIYNYAFRFGDYGAATALSLLLAVVLSILSAVYLKATKSWSTT
jgi:multiple sugar transport system permease protein